VKWGRGGRFRGGDEQHGSESAGKGRREGLPRMREAAAPDPGRGAGDPVERAWRGGGGGRRRAAGLEPASTVLGREIEEEGRLGGEERDELPSCRTRRLYAPLHSSGVYSVLLVLPPF